MSIEGFHSPKTYTTQGVLLSELCEVMSISLTERSSVWVFMFVLPP